MESRSQTTIVIAHRLSTITGADRIGVILDGKVRELGTHEELMQKPNGHYRRLQAFQDLQSSRRKSFILPSKSVSRKSAPASTASTGHEKEKDETKSTDTIDNKTAKSNARRARLLAGEDRYLFFIGGVGAILAG